MEIENFWNVYSMEFYTFDAYTTRLEYIIYYQL
jgi:hypothetical protein